MHTHFIGRISNNSPYASEPHWYAEVYAALLGGGEKLVASEYVPGNNALRAARRAKKRAKQMNKADQLVDVRS